MHFYSELDETKRINIENYISENYMRMFVYFTE